MAYNALIAPRLIADVPSVKQMRELFQLLAAKSKHPQLRVKPAEFLDRDDLETLREELKHLSDAEVAEFLQRISDDLPDNRQTVCSLTDHCELYSSAPFMPTW